MIGLRTVTVLAVLVIGLVGTAAIASAQGPNGRPQSWADGELFAGVVTPATFNPASEPFDELYHGIVGQDGPGQGGGFLNGVPLISESKPGDQDYNGGRWHLNILKAGVPAGKYAGATSVADLNLADFVSTASQEGEELDSKVGFQ